MLLPDTCILLLEIIKSYFDGFVGFVILPLPARQSLASPSGWCLRAYQKEEARTGGKWDMVILVFLTPLVTFIETELICELMFTKLVE